MQYLGIQCLSSGKQCLQQCPRWRTVPRYIIKTRPRRIKLSPNSSTATPDKKKKKKNASRIFIAIQKFPKPNKIHNLAFNQISKQAKKQESMIHYKNYQSNEMNPKLIQMIESIDKDMKTVIQYIQKIQIQKILKRFNELQEVKVKKKKKTTG